MQKVVSVQNGVDIDKIDRVSVESYDTQSSQLITLIYTARIITLKAHESLLRIVSELPRM